MQMSFVNKLFSATGALAVAFGISVGQAAAQTPAAGPTAVAGADGFGLRSADGQFNLRIRGGFQADQRIFLDDPNDNLINQLELRRARLDLTATAFQNFEFRLHNELVNSRVETLDVYGNIRFTPAVQLRVGKMKGPVGLERLQSSWVVAFVERGFPTSLLPNRDIGAQLHGSLAGGIAEYAIGVFNGVPDGGSAEADVGDSKDLNARLVLSPFRSTEVAALQGLSVGVGVTTGNQNGSPASPLLSSVRSNGREVIFRYRSNGQADGTAIATDRRTRISPQAVWYWKNFYALGEYAKVDHTLSIGESRRDLTNSAWQVAASVVLTGESATGRNINPSRPFNPQTGDWGAFEIVGRVHGIDFDEATFPTFANPAQAVQSASGFTAGLNWHLNRAVKILVNYEQTNFTAPAGGTERPTEKVLVSRLQFAI